MKIYRSHLLFPADEPLKYEKAILSGADAVAADLEDSIPLDRKQDAMSTLLDWIAGNNWAAGRILNK